MTALMFYNVFLTLAFLNVLPGRLAQVLEILVCLYLLTFLKIPRIKTLGVVGLFLYILLVLWSIFIILNGGFASSYNIVHLLPAHSLSITMNFSPEIVLAFQNVFHSLHIVFCYGFTSADSINLYRNTSLQNSVINSFLAF